MQEAGNDWIGLDWIRIPLLARRPDDFLILNCMYYDVCSTFLILRVRTVLIMQAQIYFSVLFSQNLAQSLKDSMPSLGPTTSEGLTRIPHKIGKRSG